MICYGVKTAAGGYKNGLSFHSSVFYQATLKDSQLRSKWLLYQVQRTSNVKFVTIPLRINPISSGTLILFI
jgi:hypothetical protein